MDLRRWLLVPLVAGGLAVDAWVHLEYAGDYRLVATSVVSQATLFRLEGIAAVLAAIAVVVLPRRATAVLAALVAGGGALAVAAYTWVDPGRLGPLPDMYEPLWFGAKTASFVAELVAAVAASALALSVRRSGGRRRSRPSPR
jgi:hypothetical protein